LEEIEKLEIFPPKNKQNNHFKLINISLKIEEKTVET
jgi:hypothetical protein